jgi:hypothetical protein
MMAMHNMSLSAVKLLVNPGIPDIDIMMPIPAAYLEAITNPEFWVSHVSSFGAIRPPQPLAGLVKRRKENDYRIIDPNALNFTTLKLQLSQPVTQLITMIPAKRAVHADTMDAENVRRMYILLQGWNEEAINAADQVEICERERFTEKYLRSIAKLVLDLEKVITAHKEVVEFLPAIEAKANTEYEGKSLPWYLHPALILHRYQKFKSELQQERKTGHRAFR